MANSIYQINKGIMRSVEFKGLQAQYIWYAGGGVLVLMILYSILYILGVNKFISLFVIGVSGAIILMKIYAMSKKYGEFGLMKAMAKKRVPAVVKSYSRAVFMKKALEENRNHQITATL